MGSLERRLSALEGRAGASRAKAFRDEHRELLRRLTREELEWLFEPGEEAQLLVPCPHVELLGCGCRGAGRERRGFEACPELHREHRRRWESLLARTGEVLARDPEEVGTLDREHAMAGRKELRGFGA